MAKNRKQLPQLIFSDQSKLPKMTQDDGDEALVRKLIDLNTRLTQIASTKNGNCATANNDNYNETAAIKPKTCTNMKELNQRISSLEEYLQNIDSQLELEHLENKRLSNILTVKELNSPKCNKLSTAYQDDSALQMLTKTIAELRYDLNNTQQQLQNERQQYVSSMTGIENKLKLLKSEHSAYKNKLQENAKRESNANNKIKRISAENDQLKLDIDHLQKKIIFCNGVIASNDESNKNVMENLKNEKCKRLNYINENEKKVNNLKNEISQLIEENNKLEMAVKDRDNLHGQLLKNKELYENTLGELLNSKKEQTELENALKQKMITLNRLDTHIIKLNEEKTNLYTQLNELKTTYNNEMDSMMQQNEYEIEKIKTTLNYQQIKYEEMANKHEHLREKLVSKAPICDDLKNRVNEQKILFEQHLNELISNHTKALQGISNDTQQINDILSLTQKNIDFNEDNDKITHRYRLIRGQSLVGRQDNVVTDDEKGEKDKVQKTELMTLGIWEPILQ